MNTSLLRKPIFIYFLQLVNMATPGVKKAPARTEAPASGLRSWVSAATDKVAAAYNGAANLVSRASPYLTWAADASWAIASTAVLVAIPVVIEVQRETTVKVLQKQKEMEVQAMEQQIKAQSGGIAGSLKTLFTGPETSE